MNQPLIQLKEVYKSFNDNHVLQGAELSIYRGEITTIIGKSGEGKSVLLKHLIGLMTPDSGRILFEGKPLSEMKKSEGRALKRKFSYMFQGTALFDSMTVFENIALPLVERTTLKPQKIRELVSDKMEQLDLGDIGHEYPSHISGGMKKRVALARALVTEPEIVLFDEPTTGLDPIRKNAVHSMIADYQKRFGFTGVMVSHDIPDIFFISQRIAMLHEGRIIFEGSPDEIRKSPDPLIHEFIQGFETRPDAMTGPAPSNESLKRFQEAMACLKGNQAGSTMVLFSIRDIDLLYERFGHVVTQTLIKSLAELLPRHLRTTDICSRHGREQILLLLPNTTVSQAKTLCENIAGRITVADIMGALPYPDFCFSVKAALAETRKEDRIEDLVTVLAARPDMIYDFKIC